MVFAPKRPETRQSLHMYHNQYLNIPIQAPTPRKPTRPYDEDFLENPDSSDSDSDSSSESGLGGVKFLGDSCDIQSIRVEPPVTTPDFFEPPLRTLPNRKDHGLNDIQPSFEYPKVPPRFAITTMAPPPRKQSSVVSMERSPDRGIPSQGSHHPRSVSRARSNPTPELWLPPGSKMPGSSPPDTFRSRSLAPPSVPHAFHRPSWSDPYVPAPVDEEQIRGRTTQTSHKTRELARQRQRREAQILSSQEKLSTLFPPGRSSTSPRVFPSDLPSHHPPPVAVADRKTGPGLTTQGTTSTTKPRPQSPRHNLPNRGAQGANPQTPGLHDDSSPIHRKQQQMDVEKLGATRRTTSQSQDNTSPTLGGATHSSQEPLHIYSTLSNLVTQLEDLCQSAKLCRQLCADREYAQHILNTLQMFLNLVTLSSRTKAKITQLLFKISKNHTMYPELVPLLGLKLCSEHPTAGGGFGDIHTGTIHGNLVSVKTARIFTSSDLDVLKKAFTKEATIWAQFSHPNVLPFYGMYLMDHNKVYSMCLISPWMDNGNVVSYLKAHPDANRDQLAIDTTQGLQYLHDKDVVHGDLKGLNILVTPFGRACLCDFGLSRLVLDPALLLWTTAGNMSARPGEGTVQWQAPEFFTSDVMCSKVTDIYALACVYHEIYTGQAPFEGTGKPVTIAYKISTGMRPVLPPHLGTSLCELISQCWAQIPEDRPEISEVSRRLLSALGKSVSDCVDPHWNAEFHANLRASMRGEIDMQSISNFESVLAKYSIRT